MLQWLKDTTRPLRHPRRFRAYGVGAIKTGTHSLANIFTPHYRAAHEPEHHDVTRILAEYHQDKINLNQLVDWLQQQDQRLWLEMNSSYLNMLCLPALLQRYPNAQFILTIRDIYSWLESVFNNTINHRDTRAILKVEYILRKTRSNDYQETDQLLDKRGLLPLNDYLNRWRNHNHFVLNTVPAEQLLIVRTHELRQDIPRIAEFLKIPAATLNADNAHSFPAREKHGLLLELDRDDLEAQVKHHCGDLMGQYFPEIRSLDDVLAPD
jgi:hypothetical protein